MGKIISSDCVEYPAKTNLGKYTFSSSFSSFYQDRITFESVTVRVAFVLRVGRLLSSHHSSVTEQFYCLVLSLRLPTQGVTILWFHHVVSSGCGWGRTEESGAESVQSHFLSFQLCASFESTICVVNCGEDRWGYSAALKFTQLHNSNKGERVAFVVPIWWLQ